MRLSHKLRKLADPRLLRSMKRHLGRVILTRRFVFRLDTEKIIAGIDPVQFQAILLGTGKRLLMTVNHLRRIILHSAKADETFANQILARVRHTEFLKIREEARLGFLYEQPVLNPAIEILCRPGIYIRSFGIVRKPFTEDDSHQVL